MISFLVGRTWSRASQLMVQFYLPSIPSNLSSATGIGRTRRSKRALQPAVDLGSTSTGEVDMGIDKAGAHRALGALGEIDHPGAGRPTPPTVRSPQSGYPRQGFPPDQSGLELPSNTLPHTRTNAFISTLPRAVILPNLQRVRFCGRWFGFVGDGK